MRASRAMWVGGSGDVRSGPSHFVLAGIPAKAGLRVDRQVGAALATVLAAHALVTTAGAATPASAAAARAPGARRTVASWPIARWTVAGRSIATHAVGSWPLASRRRTVRYRLALRFHAPRFIPTRLVAARLVAARLIASTLSSAARLVTGLLPASGVAAVPIGPPVAATSAARTAIAALVAGAARLARRFAHWRRAAVGLCGGCPRGGRGSKQALQAAEEPFGRRRFDHHRDNLGRRRRDHRRCGLGHQRGHGRWLGRRLAFALDRFGHDRRGRDLVADL